MCVRRTVGGERRRWWKRPVMFRTLRLIPFKSARFKLGDSGIKGVIWVGWMLLGDQVITCAGAAEGPQCLGRRSEEIRFLLQIFVSFYTLGEKRSFVLFSASHKGTQSFLRHRAGRSHLSAAVSTYSRQHAHGEHTSKQQSRSKSLADALSELITMFLIKRFKG